MMKSQIDADTNSQARFPYSNRMKVKQSRGITAMNKYLVCVPFGEDLEPADKEPTGTVINKQRIIKRRL